MDWVLVLTHVNEIYFHKTKKAARLNLETCKGWKIYAEDSIFAKCKRCEQRKAQYSRFCFACLYPITTY